LRKELRVSCRLQAARGTLRRLQAAQGTLRRLQAAEPKSAPQFRVNLLFKPIIIVA